MNGLALVGDVVAGKLEFSEFARRARPDYFRIAAYIARKDSLPSGVELDDVVQVLLDRTWYYLPKWNPARGQSPQKFVAYNIVTRTRRWLRFQRVRIDAMNRALYEGDGTEDDSQASIWSSWHAAPADQDSTLDFEQRRDVLIQALSPGAQIFARAILLANYDYAKAARNIYANRDLRYRFQFGSEREVRVLAKRLTRRLLEV